MLYKMIMLSNKESSEMANPFENILKEVYQKEIKNKKNTNTKGSSRREGELDLFEQSVRETQDPEKEQKKRLEEYLKKSKQSNYEKLNHHRMVTQEFRSF